MARNVRARDGEIDIVAAQAQTLIFIEVKTRKAARRAEYSGFAAIDKRKQAHIRRVAAKWVRRNRLTIRRLRIKSQRFDAIEVLYSKRCFGLITITSVNHKTTAI